MQGEGGGVGVGLVGAGEDVFDEDRTEAMLATTQTTKARVRILVPCLSRKYTHSGLTCFGLWRSQFLGVRSSLKASRSSGLEDFMGNQRLCAGGHECRGQGRGGG